MAALETAPAQDLDFEILILGEFDDELRCESVSMHDSGSCGHVPGQSAAFLIVRPCGCPDFLVCAGRALFIASNRDTYAFCTSCRAEARFRFYRVIPLDGDPR